MLSKHKLEYQRLWRKKNKKKEIEYRLKYGRKTIKSMHKIRFGGLRDEVLKRDKNKCQICGLTDKEHLNIFSAHLTIDHIDGSGRYSEKHNNSIDNLWTLCYPCHGRRDACRYLLSKGKLKTLIDLKLYKLE